MSSVDSQYYYVDSKLDISKYIYYGNHLLKIG